MARANASLVLFSIPRDAPMLQLANSAIYAIQRRRRGGRGKSEQQRRLLKDYIFLWSAETGR
jgi:hypothetical protein